ncbi:MAG: YggS family pyridoxal phosphate-dependent enzyme [Planctomycetota bacterium]
MTNKPAAGEAERIGDNFAKLHDEVAAACRQAGRQLSDVTIIGVSKYVGPRQTSLLVQAGCNHLGESRPQVLWQKAESDQINQPVDWHMIGHVQRNKVKRMLRRPVRIHSIDSKRILDAIAADGVERQTTHDVLIEVNISGDPDKTGLSIQDAETLIASEPREGIRVSGLMTMASRRPEAGSAGSQFEKLRAYRDRWEIEHGVQLRELSMGMSQDFAEAIDVGATLIRVGSRLFEGVTYDPA